MVCGTVHQLASLGDPEANAEPVGLAPSHPSLRPADILTSATSCGLAALDVGVCSPEATGAGLDCCEAMYRRKLHNYRGILPELQARGIRYLPMVWSSYGRAHPEAENTLQLLARTAARRRGLRDWRCLLARTRRSVAVQLQRRLVAQLHACLHADLGSCEDEMWEAEGRSPRDREPADEEAAADILASARGAGAGPVVGLAGLG
jgi:hypothetical protein